MAEKKSWIRPPSVGNAFLFGCASYVAMRLCTDTYLHSEISHADRDEWWTTKNSTDDFKWYLIPEDTPKDLVKLGFKPKRWVYGFCHKERMVLHECSDGTREWRCQPWKHRPSDL